jgi:hypothetical protein
LSTIWKISNLVVDCGGFFRPHLDAASVNVVPKKEKMLNLLNPLSAGSEADYHFCDDRVKKTVIQKGSLITLLG